MTKIILLGQLRAEIVKQEHQVESCITELQQQTDAQRFELQDAQRGFIESRREQVRLQEDPKHARNGRIGKSSGVQKLRENHETTQKLASQLQEMQEQMISMNDSGEFQEVESNFSVRLSYVSSQLAMIPSSRSMLSRDKRLPLDTRNTSGLQKNCW